MRGRSWIVVTALLVIIAGLIGSTRNSPPPLRLETNLLPEITGYIQQSRLGHPVNHVRILYLQRIQRGDYVYASFRSDGKTSYSSIELRQPDYTMCTITTPTGGKPITPWQNLVNMSIHENQGNMITGTMNNPAVKVMILTFTDGSVATVAVHGGFFCYVHPSPLPSRGSVVRYVGVTKTGQVITTPG